MNICLIGGIYAKGGERKTSLRITPETTLEAGLRSEGHHVTTLSHYDEADFSRFDVVHVHHLSYGAVRLAVDRSPVPFVFTAHDTSRMCGLPQERLHRLGMPFVLSRADGVVALTAREAEFQQRAFALDGAAHTAIANGIDADIYPYRRANTAGRGRRWQILFVGQLIPLKGVDLLIRALSVLPGSPELTLVYQSNLLEPELRQLAESLGIAHRVNFAGKLDPPQLAARYHASDILVLPSASEALPSVITEAMLCGLPFVATATGGIPEQAAGFGMLLKQRTAQSIAAGIQHVFEHYDEFECAGPAMSASARERFSIPAMVRRHVSLYRRLAGYTSTPRRQAGRHAVGNAMARLLLRRARASRPVSVNRPMPVTES